MLSCVAAVYDREMAPYRAVLADDAKTVGFGGATTFCADAWTASVESQLEAFSGAQHLMSPQSATVSGDTTSAQTRVRTLHVVKVGDDAMFAPRAPYLTNFLRTSDGRKNCPP